MNWITLDKAQAESFIKQVAVEDAKILFEPSICDVYALPLEFYDGYSLYRICNKYTIPYAQFDFLSNGEDHYYLDGSEAAFHKLNARGAISLDHKNAFYYLSLYISYVYERGNSLGFLGEYETSEVVYNPETDCYRISTPLTYQDAVVQGVIDVHSSGIINVLEPLKVTFLGQLNPHMGTSFFHPREDVIIEQCINLLDHTQQGKRYLELFREKKPSIRVVSSPDYQAICTNLRTIYLFMPAEEHTAQYLQALLFLGCLRDMEQILDDKYPHPHPVHDEETYGKSNFGKNLDMLIEMCKMVEELEKQNIAEGLHDLGKMGFIPFYHAYKSGLKEESLLEVYLTALRGNGIVEDI
jgi:hypothetical protein